MIEHEQIGNALLAIIVRRQNIFFYLFAYVDAVLLATHASRITLQILGNNLAPDRQKSYSIQLELTLNLKFQDIEDICVYCNLYH